MSEALSMAATPLRVPTPLMRPFMAKAPEGAATGSLRSLALSFPIRPEKSTDVGEESSTCAKFHSDMLQLAHEQQVIFREWVCQELIQSSHGQQELLQDWISRWDCEHSRQVEQLGQGLDSMMTTLVLQLGQKIKEELAHGSASVGRRTPPSSLGTDGSGVAAQCSSQLWNLPVTEQVPSEQAANLTDWKSQPNFSSPWQGHSTLALAGSQCEGDEFPFQNSSGSKLSSRPSVTFFTADDTNVSFRHVRTVQSSKSLVAPQRAIVKETIGINRSTCTRVVETWQFKMTCGFLIISNTLFTGFEVNSSMEQALEGPLLEESPLFVFINRLFCTVFSIELIMRIAAYRLSFFKGVDWKWNAFDAVMVICSVAEEMLQGANMSSLRMLRVLRLVRTLRIIRVMEIFRNLRMMTVCILNSMMSLIWVLIMLLLVMYMFSIVFVQGAATHVQTNPILDTVPLEARWVLQAAIQEDSDELDAQSLRSELELYYRDIPRALLTLLMSVSGGIDWYQAVRPLWNVSVVYAFLFMSFVVFVVLGLLNILSALFVEHAMQVHDRDLLIQAEISRTQAFLRDMSELFQEADVDNSGILTREEMHQYLRKERVAMYMASLQLDVSDLELMFKLLDVNESGEIELEEFVLGCFRLKGHAKCLDLCRITHTICALQSQLDQIQLALRNQLAAPSTAPREIANSTGSQPGTDLAGGPTLVADEAPILATVFGTRLAPHDYFPTPDEPSIGPAGIQTALDPDMVLG